MNTFGLNERALLEQLHEEAPGDSGRYPFGAATLPYLHWLHKMPGVDLVPIVQTGSTWPAQGYLLSAEISPGYDGGITIFPYTGDSLVARVHLDEPLKSASFNLGRFGVHRVVYDNPRATCKDMQPHRRMGPTYMPNGFNDFDIYQLQNGGQLLSQKGITQIEQGFYGSSVSTLDLHPDADSEGVIGSVRINRILETTQDLGSALVHVAVGMGLTARDTLTVLDVTAQKIPSPDVL